MSFTAIINIIDLYSKVSPLESFRYCGEDISHLSLAGGVEDVAHATFKLNIIFIIFIIIITSKMSFVLACWERNEGKIVWFIYQATTASYLRIDKPLH